MNDLGKLGIVAAGLLLLRKLKSNQTSTLPAYGRVTLPVGVSIYLKSNGQYSYYGPLQDSLTVDLTPDPNNPDYSYFTVETGKPPKVGR